VLVDVEAADIDEFLGGSARWDGGKGGGWTIGGVELEVEFLVDLEETGKGRRMAVLQGRAKKKLLGLAHLSSVRERGEAESGATKRTTYHEID
jgi:hypothetical protein